MPELIWNGKEEAVKAAGKVPYRLLKEDRNLGYGDDSENMLIQGDNLAALKSLLPYYKGRVKCIYADKRQAYLIQANGNEKASQSLGIWACEALQDYGAVA